jgi:glycosyltransferase involved in cell wall biosynthesis
MILVDAVYINNSGGKILLDYLIQQLEETDIEIYYLLDKRIEHKHPKIKISNQVKYIKGGFIPRLVFYFKNTIKYKSILCFGNFPPPIKQKYITYTYFHNLLFINPSKDDSSIFRLLTRLKINLFSFLSKNSNYWIVQTSLMKKSLFHKFNNIAENNVYVLPFFPTLKLKSEINRVSNKFIYVSTGFKYKNHERLIISFVNFFDKHKIGELHFTIGFEYEKLINFIKSLQELGYPLVNHGIVEKPHLTQLYNSSEYVIFPSLVESFGLGIVEGIDNGCKIIASDLPWVYSVCEPSLVFDPFCLKSIEKAFETATLSNLKFSNKLITNEISAIIDLLKNT